MNVSINIQSYKRAGLVDTMKIVPDVCRLWVHSFEAGEYRKHYGKSVFVLPDDTRGNLPKVKNYILDNTEADVTVIMDDDIKYIGYWEKKELKVLAKDDLLPFIERYSIIAEGIGAKLWGVNLNQDKQVYREYSPFSTLSYVSSSFSCFLKGNELRYDDRFPLKEDYDMHIAQCNKYRKVLRVNKFFYYKKSAENIGGCAVYRNVDREKEQLALLQKKWGNRIVQSDSLTHSRSHSSGKKRNFDINPVVTIPIRGI